MNKKVLRDLYLAKRKTLARQEFDHRNRQVFRQAVDFIREKALKNVHLFLPIARNYEVDTWPVYHFLLESGHYRPILPKSHFKTQRLTHHPMIPSDTLVENTYGIPEPRHDRKISEQAIDLVLVPLIAFDRAGNRIGYGAGFYDRFLSKCRPDTIKTGLAVTPPLDLIEDTEPHDIRLNYCINHHGIYHFNP